MRLKYLLIGIVVTAALVVVAGIGFLYLAPERAAKVAIDAERNRAGLVRKEIDVPGGLHHVYLEGGHGEPLLLLHGFGANKDNFTRVARFLTPHYRVVVPDHIGFGESAHPPDADYSPTAQAERLHALVQALGIQGVHVGGNSMGGQIALVYAALHPTEVKSLWLIDAGGVWSAPESEGRRIIRETKRNPLLVRNEEEFRQLIAFTMSDPPFIPPPLVEVLAQERVHNFALEERIFNQLRDESVENRIAGLATPSLIVWGERDRVLNVATAEILQKLLPQSQVVIMPGVGHLPMVERPEQSARDYLRFRASAAGTPAAN